MSGYQINALKQVNNGLAPDDGSGDSLRTGAEIINNNFNVTRTVVNSQAAVDEITLEGNGLVVDTGSGASLLGGSQTLNANSAALAQAVNNLAASQAAGTISYLTLAAMNADLTPADGVVAYVTNDSTVSNNGWYRKNGASGTGSWGATVNPVSNALTVALGNAAGFQQAGTGAVLRTVNDKASDVYNVFDLFSPSQKADALSGAPIIDTTALIQQALDNAAARGQTCYAYGVFRVSAKITFKGNADFSQARFNVTGAPPIALEVSTGSAPNPVDKVFNLVVRLPQQTNNMAKPASGWSGQGIGVRLVNCYSCEVHFGHVAGFATNVLVTSFGGSGNCYNEYHCGQLDNGMVNLHIVPGDSNSWVNENLFVGGRFQHNSAEGTNVTGVRHILIGEADQIVNNNLFLKPSIEANVPEYHVENAGTANTILQGRWEASPPKVLYSGAGYGYGMFNAILQGYGANSIQVTMTGYSTLTKFNTLKTSYGMDTIVSGFSSFNNVPAGAANVYTFNSDGSGFQLTNHSSDAYGCAYVYSSAIDPKAVTGKNYNVRIGATYCGFKGSQDAYDRIQIQPTSGQLKFGSGLADPPCSMFYASGGVTLNKGMGQWGVIAPSSRPVVSGAKGGNAALTSLIAALVSYGLISDNST